MKRLVILFVLAACGSGVQSEPGDPSPLPLRTGDHHNCLLKSDRTVWCWGRNQYGELGVSAMMDSPTPVQSAFTDAIAIAPGHQATCGVKSDRTSWCWGRIIDGNFHSDPVALAGGDGVEDISLVQGALCARKTGGSVWCWTTGLTTPPIEMISSGVVQATWNCAVMTDGTVSCWGNNDYGQLGDGTNSGTGPVTVVGLSDVVEVGSYSNTNCARRGDGSVWCWGYNAEAELGVSPTTTVCAFSNNMWPCRPIARPIPSLSGVAALAVGSSFNVVVSASGTLAAWGQDGAGELGGPAGGCGSTFSTSCSAATVAVPTVAGVRILAAGDSHACACQEDGAIYCWGAESGTGVTRVPDLSCD